MRLVIELQSEAEGQVVGSLLAGDARAVGFDGWLGLLRALEDAIAEHGGYNSPWSLPRVGSPSATVDNRTNRE